MGLLYVGPVDGHDISVLRCPNWQKARQDGPHSCDHPEGKGMHSEETPDKYMVFQNSTELGIDDDARCFSLVFGENWTALAKKDIRICAITAAMTSGTGLRTCAAISQRFFVVGIAEEHGAAMAAGLQARELYGLCRLFYVPQRP
jgi:1-deoxy-D-xylulose-5-phosphate synthase